MKASITITTVTARFGGVSASLTQERLGTKEKPKMAAEAIIVVKVLFLRQTIDEETAFGVLAFPNVFSDVNLYVNARIMRGAGCRTQRIATTLTDRAALPFGNPKSHPGYRYGYYLELPIVFSTKRPSTFAC